MVADSCSISIDLPDLAATEALGRWIASGLRPGDALALYGELGAGKTTLVRAILAALGVSEHVPSPTFTLVQSYETARLTVRHYDLYRIRSSAELAELGLEEALDEGAVLIEWPERAGEFLPQDALTIRLSGNQIRRADITGPARWAAHSKDPTLVR